MISLLHATTTGSMKMFMQNTVNEIVREGTEIYSSILTHRQLQPGQDYIQPLMVKKIDGKKRI